MRSIRIMLFLALALMLAVGCEENNTLDARRDDRAVPVTRALESAAPEPERVAPAPPRPLELEGGDQDTTIDIPAANLRTLSDDSPELASLSGIEQDQRPLNLSALDTATPASEEDAVPRDDTITQTIGDGDAPRRNIEPEPGDTMPRLAPLPDPAPDLPAPDTEMEHPEMELPAKADIPAAEPRRPATENGGNTAAFPEGARAMTLSEIIDHSQRRIEAKQDDQPEEFPEQATPLEVPSPQPDLEERREPFQPITEDLPTNSEAEQIAENLRRNSDEFIFAPPKPHQEDIVFGKEEVVAGSSVQINNNYLTPDEILTGMHEEILAIPSHISGDLYRRQVAMLLQQQMPLQIQDILVYEEANDMLADGMKQQIDLEMEDLLREMIATAGSEQKLRQKCLREGTTLQGLLEWHRRRVTGSMYLRQKLYPAIQINRRNLWNFYQRHQDDYRTEKRVQMQILAAPFREFLPNETARPSEGELQIAKRAAGLAIEQALGDLHENDFTEVLVAFHKKHNIVQPDKGIWPMMSKGNFRETKVEQAAFSLEEGQHSNVIETDTGFYIVRAIKINPGKEVSFEDAQDEIIRDLRREQFGELRMKYMKKLYEGATIVVPDNFMPVTVERAVERYRP